MAVFINNKINNDLHLGIWQIDESSNELKGLLNLTNEEVLVYNSFKTELRKIHWLSYRLLFKEMTGGNLSIFYDNHGKPIIDKNIKFLSVTHSGIYSAILLSNTQSVGIDIEKIDSKINRIYHKFVSDKDYQLSIGQNQLEILYIHWCAKEALYKAYGKGLLDFKKQIFIEPFNYNTKGFIFGSYLINNILHSYKLQYEKIGDYMLVYTIEKY